MRPVSVLAGRTGLIFHTCFTGGTGEVHTVCVLSFIRVVKSHLQSLLPCLISNSSETLSVWDDEERM